MGLLIVSANLQAQEKKAFDFERKYHPDSLKRWTQSVMTELSRKHPGFNRYTSKARFDFVIDSTVQTITDSLTTIEFYRKVKPLFAQIACLHTAVSLSEEIETYIDKAQSLIPFEIFIDADKRVFLTKNHSTTEISLKSEILAINNKPIGEILGILLKSIPSDGYNETEKILMLNHRFAFWYRTIIDVSQNFEVEILSNDKWRRIEVKGISKEVFPTMDSLESAHKKQLHFEIANRVGILTIHSFAKSAIKRNGQNFKKFIKSTFKDLGKKQVKNLVIDLRYNTGGTDGNAVLLASYFFDKSFRYWDRIEVTEAVAKEIKGVYKLFYRKPHKRDTSYLWRTTWFTNEFDYYKMQKPAKFSFTGQTYLLTNGLCLSSCADVIAILAHNKKAKVVGQESGGGYQGNTSGMMPKTKIPTGLEITVPLLKYTNAVDPMVNMGRGTIPDYVVAPSLDNWIEKDDVEKEFIMQLISTME
jgi:Peptidase family S41